MEKPRDLSVLICTPCLGDIKSGCAWSVARAMAHFLSIPYNGERLCDWEILKSSNLVESRTRLVSRAFGRGATHILWVDSDEKFPADTIVRLLNHNKAVVGCNYPTKEIRSRPTAYCDGDDYIGPCWTKPDSTGLQEVAHLGMGVLLTDCGVFDKIDLPYFAFEQMPPDYIKTKTEDVYFCEKVRKAGIPIFVDHDLSKQVGHIGDFDYTNEWANRAEETKQQIYRGDS